MASPGTTTCGPAAERASEPRRERGFTLVELLLVLALSLILLIAVLNLFDGMNRMARVQVNLADLQQAQRVAQGEVVKMVRMAGRGGLREDLLGASVAELASVALRNNVGAGGVAREVVAGSGVEATEGSDVLVLRGVFSTPIYRVDYVDPAAFDPAASRVTIRLATPTGVPQDLAPLREAVEKERPEALVLTDALGDAYGVAELVPGDSVVGADAVTLAFRTAGTARAARYAALSSGGAFPGLQKVLSVGLLEEHRFYVRPGDPDPVLARTRTYPNNEEAYPGELDREVAPNIRDLQVALGFDSSEGGGFFDCDDDAEGDDDRLVESDDGSEDDWLFNAPDGATGEDEGAAPWSPPPGGWQAPPALCGDVPRPRLFYVRVATLAVSPNADPRYTAPVLETLEDRTYGLASDDPINGEAARRSRRRILQTTVDLRNL